MNADDLTAYAYMVEDSMSKPEMFQLAVEQLSEQLGERESVIAAVLLGCYSWNNANGSLRVFLYDWLNSKVEAIY